MVTLDVSIEAEVKRLIVFVDDDPTEVETFLDLYSDERFEIVPVHAPSSPEALSLIKGSLGMRRPDLFVLDMFLPVSPNAPTAPSPSGIKTGVAELHELRQSITEIEEMIGDGKALLRSTQGLVARAEALVKTWSEELGQSPKGGIALLQELDSLYHNAPKVFYSRKATVEDVKLALAAGALDVIRKPDSSHAEVIARHAIDTFLAACDWRAPQYLSKWQSALKGRVQS